MWSVTEEMASSILANDYRQTPFQTSTNIENLHQIVRYLRMISCLPPPTRFWRPRGRRGRPRPLHPRPHLRRQGRPVRLAAFIYENVTNNDLKVSSDVTEMTPCNGSCLDTKTEDAKRHPVFKLKSWKRVQAVVDPLLSCGSC